MRIISLGVYTASHGYMANDSYADLQTEWRWEHANSPQYHSPHLLSDTASTKQ